MTFFLIILFLIAVFWIMYGRGALIVHRHKWDEGVFLPQDLKDKESITVFLKKELTYKDLNDIYFDENGNVCIAGKYDTYYIHLGNGKIYVDEKIPNIFDSNVNNNRNSAQTMSWSYLCRCFSRKNARRIEELECIRAYIIKTLDHNAPINAHQKYVRMKTVHKYSGWISGVFSALAVILIIVSLATDSDSAAVRFVRGGHFKSYSSTITVGEAFEDYFVDTEWSSYTKNEEKFVKFKGECQWNNKSAEINIIFELDGDYFFIDEIILYTDNERIDSLSQDYILREIYDNYEK